MRKLATASYTTKDITTPLLVHSHTSDAARLVFVRLFISTVAGGGDYTAFVTVQRAGAGSEFYIVPITITPVDSGYGAICLSSVSIPVDTNDVIRAYLQGLITDTSVDIYAEVWEDDSNFHTTVPAGYPSGTLGYALSMIGTSPVVRVQVPVRTNNKITLVRGDDYTADHGTALTFSSEQWPNITGATIALIGPSAFTAAGSVVGAGEAMVELDTDDTTAMLAGSYSLVATFPDTHRVTLVPRLQIQMLEEVE